MMLTETQHNHLDVVNKNITGQTDSHDAFMDSMESLLEDNIDVSEALNEIFGTELD